MSKMWLCTSFEESSPPGVRTGLRVTTCLELLMFLQDPKHIFGDISGIKQPLERIETKSRG